MSDPWICNAAWNSITFFPNAKIAPCCLQHVDNHRPLSTFAGVDTFRDMQQLMLQGQVPPGCEGCRIQENKNQRSYRMFYGDNPRFRNNIRHIDLRNTNLCNLACRMCGPESSSTWAKILDQGFITNTSVFEYIDPLLTKHLIDVYITGGEPMLNPDHWDMLDRLIENNLSQNVKLRYNTNLTTLSYKNRHVKDYWKKFNEVTVLCSLEAIGKPLECIRSRSKWDNINSRIDELLALKQEFNNINIEVNCTVSALNVWFIPELVVYCQERNITIQFFELTNPEYFSIVNLPIEYRRQALDVLRSLNSTSRVISSVIEFTNMTNTGHLYDRLLSQILLMDKLNNENLFDLMPFRKNAISYLTRY